METYADTACLLMLHRTITAKVAVHSWRTTMPSAFATSDSGDTAFDYSAPPVPMEPLPVGVIGDEL